MTYNELYNGLRMLAVETGSLPCLGCGHENNCGIKGCAICRAAAETIRQLRAKLEITEAALKAVQEK